MKKILTIVAILFTINASSQILDTVSVTLVMRSQDWAWAIGHYGTGTDSTSRAKVRLIRNAIIAANPSTWATNVTINNVPGVIVMYIYASFTAAPFGEVLQMGTTTAERTTIYTNIRAINNSALQYHIGRVDGGFITSYLNTRTNGKNIVLDN